jgi:hypothetical protein
MGLWHLQQGTVVVQRLVVHLYRQACTHSELAKPLEWMTLNKKWAFLHRTFQMGDKFQKMAARCNPL